MYNFVMLIITRNHAMFLVQLGLNNTRGVSKFCQIGLSAAAGPNKIFKHHSYD